MLRIIFEPDGMELSKCFCFFHRSQVHPPKVLLKLNLEKNLWVFFRNDVNRDFWIFVLDSGVLVLSSFSMCQRTEPSLSNNKRT